MTPHNRTTDSLKETGTHVPGALNWLHFSLGPGHTSANAIQQTATVVNTTLPHLLGELPATARFDADTLAVLTELVGVTAWRVKGDHDRQVEHRGDGALNPLHVLSGDVPEEFVLPEPQWTEREDVDHDHAAHRLPTGHGNEHTEAVLDLLDEHVQNAARMQPDHDVILGENGALPVDCGDTPDRPPQSFGHAASAS
ncbi:hypothetical protein ACIF80_35070 [Streptomyces sp. NPDC085927]|uniref:hypothetical protein n=1 Tax=Streptomyces sp. NPDC085927 TaxID=3365738 RepID=UPI0037CE9AA0